MMSSDASERASERIEALARARARARTQPRISAFDSSAENIRRDARTISFLVI